MYTPVRVYMGETLHIRDLTVNDYICILVQQLIADCYVYERADKMTYFWDAIQDYYRDEIEDIPLGLEVQVNYHRLEWASDYLRNVLQNVIDNEGISGS